MVSIATPTPKIEFPCSFPAEATLPLLENLRIPLPVGRMVVEYCVLPRRVIFLGIDGVVINLGSFGSGLFPALLDASAISNLETLVKRASEVADLAIVILIGSKDAISTHRFKEWLFKDYSFSSLIIDAISPTPELSYDQLIDKWANDKTHLKINGYVIISYLEVISIYPKNFIDTFAMLSETDVERGFKILDESSPPGTKKS